MESDTYRFISLIEKHPQLYNKKHKDFLRQDIRNTIWDSICKEMNWDGKLVFFCWHKHSNMLNFKRELILLRSSELNAIQEYEY